MTDASFFGVRLAFSLAVASLCFIVAFVLAFAPPATTPKRLLAAYLALTGGSEFYFVQYGLAGSAATGELLPLLAYRVDVLLLSWLAFAAFVAVYPTRVKWPSAHAIVVLACGAMFLLGLAVFLFDRGAIYVTLATASGPQLHQTLLGRVLVGEGVAVAHVLLVASVAWRARRAPSEPHATTLASGAAAWLFGIAGTTVLVLAVSAIRSGWSAFAFLAGTPPDDPLHVSIALFLVSNVGALALAVFFAARARSPFALLMVAFGFLLNLALMFATPVDFFAVNWVFVALVPALLVAQHGALATFSLPRWSRLALAFGSLPAVFLLTVVMVLLSFGDGSLSLAVAIFLGFVLGGAVATRFAPLALLAGAAPAPLPRIEPGALVAGRYRVGRPLGAGGEGTAYLARDERLSRDVVLKTFSGALREARVLAQIRHPNVVSVFDVLDHGHEGAIVMEYAEGGSLAAKLAAPGRLSAHEAAAIADGMLAGLAACHAAGIIHRDVKPANVLFTRDGAVKVADFGVARSGGADATFTAGRWAGTPRYMAPEQARGAHADARSDIYATGIVLEEMVAGRADEPLDARDVPDRASSERLTARLPAEAAALEPVLRRALALDPGARFQSAAEMRRELAAAVASLPSGF
ncbi:MAG: serine/threonine-protein kinase [Thermoplasmatota archaeon]